MEEGGRGLRGGSVKEHTAVVSRNLLRFCATRSKKKLTFETGHSVLMRMNFSAPQACKHAPIAQKDALCPRTPHWGRGSKGSNYGGGFVQVRIVGRGELAGWGKCLNPRNWIRHRSIMTGSRRNSAGIMIGIGKGFDTEVPKKLMV